MIETPTSHVIARSSGALSRAPGSYEKRLADLDGIYANSDAFRSVAQTDGERVVYRVEDARPEVAEGGLIFGTTYMEPGRIDNEFFVTRGHLHARADRPETYRGESGEGVLLLESPEGETRTLEIAAEVLVYVPPFWVHRSVNTGSDPLVMSFCYPADAGQNYDIIDRANGMAARIVAAPHGGWTLVPNIAYQPRSQAEIDAIYAGREVPQ